MSRGSPPSGTKNRIIGLWNRPCRNWRSWSKSPGARAAWPEAREGSSRRGALHDRLRVDAGQRAIGVRAPRLEARSAEGLGDRGAGADERRRLEAEREPVAEIASAGLEIG